MRTTNIRTHVTSSMSGRMSGDSTTSLFCRDLGTRWLTTRSEGHSNGWAKGLGKKPRSPNLSFQGRVGNVAHAPDTLVRTARTPGTAEARAPAAAHVTVAAPVAENAERGVTLSCTAFFTPRVACQHIQLYRGISDLKSHQAPPLVCSALARGSSLCTSISGWSRVACRCRRLA